MMNQTLLTYPWKYLSAAAPSAPLRSIASREPMPLYFFKRTPLLKKYSPGASEVPANMEPIITEQMRGYIDSISIPWNYLAKDNNNHVCFPFPLGSFLPFVGHPDILQRTIRTKKFKFLTCGGSQGECLDDVSD